MTKPVLTFKLASEKLLDFQFRILGVGHNDRQIYLVENAGGNKMHPENVPSRKAAATQTPWKAVFYNEPSPHTPPPHWPGTRPAPATQSATAGLGF